MILLSGGIVVSSNPPQDRRACWQSVSCRCFSSLPQPAPGHCQKGPLGPGQHLHSGSFRDRSHPGLGIHLWASLPALATCAAQTSQSSNDSQPLPCMVSSQSLKTWRLQNGALHVVAQVCTAFKSNAPRIRPLTLSRAMTRDSQRKDAAAKDYQLSLSPRFQLSYCRWHLQVS